MDDDFQEEDGSIARQRREEDLDFAEDGEDETIRKYEEELLLLNAELEETGSGGDANADDALYAELDTDEHAQTDARSYEYRSHPADEGLDQGIYDDYDAIPIGDRLYLKGQEVLRKKEERAQQAESDKQKREQMQTQRKPKISESGAKANRSGGDPEKFYKLQTDWLKRRNHVLDTKRDLEKREQTAVNREQKASAMSNRILAGRYKNPVDHWEERVQHYNSVHQGQQVTSTFKPTISPAAQHLKRAEPVTERLYNSAKQKQDAPKRLPHAASHKKISQENLNALIRKMKLHDDTARRKREAKLREIKLEEGSYQPEINPRSLEILRRQGGHVPVHLRSVSAQNHPPPREVHEQQHAPPMLDLEKVKPIEDAYWKKICTSQTRREDKLAKMRREAAEEVTEDCTFIPATNRKSQQLAKKTHRSRSEDTHSPAAKVVGYADYVCGGYTPVGDGSFFAKADAAAESNRSRKASVEPGRTLTDLAQHIDSSFVEWDDEWKHQQDDIEAILRQYSSANERTKMEISSVYSLDRSPCRNPRSGSGAESYRPSSSLPSSIPRNDDSLHAQYAARPAARAEAHATFQGDVDRHSQQRQPRHDDPADFAPASAPESRSVSPAERRGGKPAAAFSHKTRAQRQAQEREQGWQQPAHGSHVSPRIRVTAASRSATADPQRSEAAPPPRRGPTEQQRKQEQEQKQQHQIAELQSVLDCWRALEDQYSSSFEELRLR
ncbi:hypothetical protein DIPPA_16778 [Diplonema papillatum]|nr:hypothetical protein DIPPA_16778 [Diplonema papillatum]